LRIINWGQLREIDVMARSNSHQNMSVSKDSQITDRRKALRRKEDEEIRQSEERFRTITENSFDGVSIIGADGTILYESPSVKWMLGYEVENRIGANAFEGIHPDDMLEAANVFQKIVNNPDETATIILRIKHEDGSWRWIECSGRNLINNASVGGIVINYHDITDRKLMEEALRKSDELYHLITDNITDVIWTTDMNLKFTYTSPSVTRLRGYSVEEAMSISLKETLTPSSFELAMKVYEEEMAIEKREQKDLNRSRCIQVEEYCKDGSTIWIDVEMTFIQDSEGKATGILGIARDITERKQAEEALRESEEKYRELINTSTDGVISVDTRMNIALWNQGAERIFGYTEEEILGQSITKIAPERYRKAKEKGFSQYAKSGTGPIIGKVLELEGLRKDGTEFPLELSVSSRRVGDTYITTAIVRDITERKQAEEALRESEERFRQIFNGVNDEIVYTDTDGVVLNVNEKIGDIFGYPPAEMIGRNVLELDLFDPDSISLIRMNYRNCLNS
jgi:PAS domain S-box-containing protein